MKKFTRRYALLLVVGLLLLSALLSACGAASEDAAKKYMDAVLAGNAAEAQKYACEDFQDQTAAFAQQVAQLADRQLALQNANLQYDIGKKNNANEVLITGAFDVARLREDGSVIPDSEMEYELAASVRDKHDLDGDGDDEELINTRIRLDMQEKDGDWCVAGLEGGYFGQDIFAPAAANADEAADTDANTEDTADTNAQ
jgi:hypothetical protein